MFSSVTSFFEYYLLFVAFSSFVGTTTVAADASSPKKPLRVFILSGQSNMQGKGKVDHLHSLLDDPEEKEKYQHLWDTSTNTWAVRNDVFVRYLDRFGNLTVSPGFADPHDRFGVEVGFGWAVGDSLQENDEQVLLIKTAWGGRALTVEFRPPTSCLDGISQYPCYYWEECDPYMPIEYGSSYRDMINNVMDTLERLDDYVPGIEDGTEVTLSGFVWFQAWNDFIDPRKVAEYGSNLQHLIRNVRLDLDAPDLPFVIGEMGQHGSAVAKREDLTADDRQHVQEFRKIQRQVTKLPEFVNTTRFVKTAPYMVVDAPEDETFDGFYHYNGRADTFYSMGVAFGEAMLDVMGETDAMEDEG